MPVRVKPHRLSARSMALVLLVCHGWRGLAASQQAPSALEVPHQFTLDMETAARLRPQLTAQSVEPLGPYATGRLIFERLVAQIEAPRTAKFAWALRIVKDDQRNAFSSPDGMVCVESGLAELAGASTGLWAAILSHEIAHVVRRDWARRYLFQKYLENGGGAVIALGDPSLPAASWSDSEKASADFGRFCRQMELDADRESLQLMARAGYHPDFVPALHHLLHARSSSATSTSLLRYGHPLLGRAGPRVKACLSDAASIESARRWREWYAFKPGEEIHLCWCLPKSPGSEKLVPRDGRSRFPCAARTWWAPWKWSCTRGQPAAKLLALIPHLTCRKREASCDS